MKSNTKMGKMAEMLDDIDREIINELQKNPYIDMEDLSLIHI